VFLVSPAVVIIADNRPGIQVQTPLQYVQLVVTDKGIS
jgi:hypothetical protein